ncbi:unnamed protein product [Moneuplotes crassus]|uniref:Uncharacterized protein n=1 Tax=Euplotes crassus TaxID=5936 RepID=A0AAD1Y2F5_EUPCR|nr:unnamed protein product [Moneuplotes crassus]
MRYGLKGIFIKLGICLNILPYYDYLHKTRHLMMQLFSGSRQLWIEDNRKIIESLHECMQVVELSESNLKYVHKLFQFPKYLPNGNIDSKQLECAYVLYKYFKFEVKVFIKVNDHLESENLNALIDLLREYYSRGSLKIKSVYFSHLTHINHFSHLEDENLELTNRVIDTILEILGLKCEQLGTLKYIIPPMVKLENNYIRGFNRIYLTRDVEIAHIEDELFELSHLSFTKEFNKLMRTKSTHTLEVFIDQFITFGNPLPQLLEEITIIVSTPSYQSEDVKQQCDVTQLIDVIEPQHKLKFIFKELSSSESRNNLCLVSKLREFAGVQVHAEFTNTNKDAFILHCLHCMLCLNVEDTTKTTYFKNVRIDCGIEDISFVSDNEYILIRSICSLKGTTQAECPSGREFATFIDSSDLINEKSTMIAVKVSDISSLALDKHFDEFINESGADQENEEIPEVPKKILNWTKLPSLLPNQCSLRLILKMDEKGAKILESIPNSLTISTLTLEIPEILNFEDNRKDDLIDRVCSILCTKRLTKFIINGVLKNNTRFLLKFVKTYFTINDNKLTELVVKGSPELFHLVLNDSTKNAYILTLKPLKAEVLMLSSEDMKLESLKHRRIVLCDDASTRCGCCTGGMMDDKYRYYSNTLR